MNVVNCENAGLVEGGVRGITGEDLSSKVIAVFTKQRWTTCVGVRGINEEDLSSKVIASCLLRYMASL